MFTLGTFSFGWNGCNLLPGLQYLIPTASFLSDSTRTRLMQMVSRRQALAFGAGATAFLTVSDIRSALATPAESDAEIAKFTGGKAVEKGKITIDLPEIAENGNTVPLQI